MNFKKNLLIMLILLVFLSSSTVNASETTDNIMNDTQDSQLAFPLNGDIAEDTIQEENVLSNSNYGSFTDLQNLISNAREEATINLDKNYSYFKGDSMAGIVIKKNMTIDGNGFTINGKDSSRIFIVGNKNAKTTITLKNIIFINGNSDFGGAIKVVGSGKEISLQINNCSFENNKGGAIYCIGNDEINSHLNITNSRFINNTAFSGGAIWSQGNSTNIENSIFKSNTAEDGDGGALEIYDNSLSIKNSVFESNKAKYDGGAIYYSSIEPMTVLNCNFTHNTARMGGAISLSCYYKKCRISNSIFISNTARKSGGAISFGYTASLKNNTFIDNNLPELEIEYEQDPYLKYGTERDFKVKIVNSLTREPVSGIKVDIYVKVLKGEEKYTIKVISAITDNDGIATFKSVAKLSEFDYSGFFHFQKSFSFVNKTDYYGAFNDPISLNSDDWELFTILFKAPTKVKAFELKVKFKKSKYFRVKITSNDKPVKYIKIKLKIYTGKKSKTYKVKTDKNGIAKFNTKNLKLGTHKVLIRSGNSYYNYKISGKSKITVKGFKTIPPNSKDKSMVKKIQKALKKNGYYLTYNGHRLKVDGLYKTFTKRAVKQFQHDKKLKVTGKVDEKTAQKLKII